MPSPDSTNRFVLRLAILYEFYKAEHATAGSPIEIAIPAIDRMDVPGPERDAALRYLVGSGLLEGKIHRTRSGPVTFPSHISVYGIDFIEKSLCTATFESVSDSLEEGESVDDCAGKRRVFERILPEVTGAGMARYADLIIELSNIACGLIPGFVDLAS